MCWVCVCSQDSKNYDMQINELRIAEQKSVEQIKELQTAVQPPAVDSEIKIEITVSENNSTDVSTLKTTVQELFRTNTLMKSKLMELGDFSFVK